MIRNIKIFFISALVLLLCFTGCALNDDRVIPETKIENSDVAYEQNSDELHEYYDLLTEAYDNRVIPETESESHTVVDEQNSDELQEYYDWVTEEYDNSVIPETESESTSVVDEQDSDELYEYYDLLTEEWDNTQARSLKYFKVYIDNDKIYFINTNPDGNIGTGDGYTWHSYDISTKEYNEIYNAEEPIFMADSNIYVNIYDSWYYDNAFYALYECTSYEIHNYYNYYCLVEMDTNGKVINRIFWDEHISINQVNDSLIVERSENGEKVYDLYSMNLALIATFNRPMKSLPHNLYEPVYISDFFSLEDNIYAIAEREFYVMDIANNSWTAVDIANKPTSGFGKYCISPSDGGIINVETGEIIYTGYLTYDYYNDYFGNTYFGGDYNIAFKNNTWYKVQYPNGKSFSYKQGEALSAESASYDDIVQLNETYYLLIDNYGVFLRTYENGETQEEVIMMFNR